MVIWIEVKEQGGVLDIRRASSVWDIDSDSWFKSINATPKVDLSILGDTITGKVLLDHTKLPNAQSFRVYARLYDKSLDLEGRLLQDDSFRLTQDDSTRLQQDQ